VISSRASFHYFLLHERLIPSIDEILEGKELQGSWLVDHEKRKADLWMEEIIRKSDRTFEKAIMENDPHNLGWPLQVYYALGLLKSKLDDWVRGVMNILSLEIKELIRITTPSPSISKCRQ
jgi:hypothetical protein